MCEYVYMCIYIYIHSYHILYRSIYIYICIYKYTYMLFRKRSTKSYLTNMCIYIRTRWYIQKKVLRSTRGDKLDNAGNMLDEALTNRINLTLQLDPATLLDPVVQSGQEQEQTTTHYHFYTLLACVILRRSSQKIRS